MHYLNALCAFIIGTALIYQVIFYKEIPWIVKMAVLVVVFVMGNIFWQQLEGAAQ